MQATSAHRHQLPHPATLLGIITVPLLLAACEQPDRAAAVPTAPPEARLTASYLSKSTPVGSRATYEPFKINRKESGKEHGKGGGWEVDIHAKDPLDVAVQTIEFPVGAHSGWHRHPGFVFISVVEGTMTFYEADDPSCSPIVKHAGEGLLDSGDHAHIARNESGLPAKNVVTYFVPPGAPLRIDVTPAPGNCPF